MKTLTDYYKNILDRQSDLGYQMKTFLRRGADNNSIKTCEDELGFALNTELKELYSLSDGVILDTDSYDEYLIPIHRLLGLSDAVACHKTHLEFPDYFANSETNFKPGPFLFPFLCDDAGNYYWVDLNKNIPDNYGKIYWTNSWGDDPDYNYSSLTSMFKTISDAYDKKIIFLENEGELTCDYKKFSSLSKLNEPTLPYWKQT